MTEFLDLSCDPYELLENTQSAMIKAEGGGVQVRYVKCKLMLREKSFLLMSVAWAFIAPIAVNYYK